MSRFSTLQNIFLRLSEYFGRLSYGKPVLVLPDFDDDQEPERFVRALGDKMIYHDDCPPRTETHDLWLVETEPAATNEEMIECLLARLPHVTLKGFTVVE